MVGYDLLIIVVSLYIVCCYIGFWTIKWSRGGGDWRGFLDGWGGERES